jgi:hypothetical protein
MALPQPAFYLPWQNFGLGIITPIELQQRTEITSKVLMRA